MDLYNYASICAYMQEVMMHNAQKEIVEKIVEREVIKEVRVGISKEEMAALEKRSEDERQRIMKQAQEDMKALIAQNGKTAQERAELQAALDREAEDRRALSEQKKQLKDKLKVRQLFFNINMNRAHTCGHYATEVGVSLRLRSVYLRLFVSCDMCLIGTKYEYFQRKLLWFSMSLCCYCVYHCLSLSMTQAMEEKLIKGGEVINIAREQEAQLRKAQQELRERQMQEAALARELAEKEEANLQLEEHFSSLQEEVEVKTKKLKKLWTKYQSATREVKEQADEFAVR